MTKEIVGLTEEQLAILNEQYPASEDTARLQLPRFGMLSKDIVEEEGKGKNKVTKVVQPAGTFYTEKDMGEKTEDGKAKWTKTFIEGETVDIIIAFHRRQLRMFDASLEKFYSTPIFDTSEQVVPLYLDKQVVKRGTQTELQAMFPAITQKGKPTSKLKEDTILFILYKNELYQCNLSQSSKWEFKSYKQKLNPSTVITTLGSTEETFGTNTYRKMGFTMKSQISSADFDTVIEAQSLLKEQVANDAQFFLAPVGEVKEIAAEANNF
jgi:hypothetical protein